MHPFPQDHCFVKEEFGLIETSGVFRDLGFVLVLLKKANELHPSVLPHISLNELVSSLEWVVPTKE